MFNLKKFLNDISLSEGKPIKELEERIEEVKILIENMKPTMEAIVYNYLGRRVPITMGIDYLSYTNHQMIKIGLHPEEALFCDNNEIARIIRFKVGHECQHCMSTNTPYDETVYDVYNDWQKKASAKGVCVNSDFLYKLVRKYANILEDGRIENIMCNDYPGLINIRNWYRIREWEETTCEDCTNLELITDSMLSIATKGMLIKDFNESKAPNNIKTLILDLITDISNYVMCGSTKDAMKHYKIICDKISDTVIDLLGSENNSALKENLDDTMSSNEKNNSSNKNEESKTMKIVTLLDSEETNKQEQKQQNGDVPDVIIDLRKNLPKPEKTEKDDNSKKPIVIRPKELDENNNEEDNTSTNNSDSSSEDNESSLDNNESSSNGAESSQEAQEDTESQNESKSMSKDAKNDSEANTDSSNSAESSSDNNESSSNGAESSQKAQEDTESQNESKSMSKDVKDDSEANTDSSNEKENNSESKDADDSDTSPNSNNTSNKDDSTETTSNEQKNDSENISSQKDSLDRVTPEDLESIMKKLSEQIDVIEDALKKSLEEAEKNTLEEAQVMNNSIYQRINAEAELANKKSKELSKADIEEISRRYNNISFREYKCKDIVNKINKIQAPPLAKARGEQLRSEIDNILATKSTPDRAELYSGVLDDTRLANLCMGQYDIFLEDGEPYDKDSCCFILIDSSGSMSGTKWVSAGTASAEIETAFKEKIPLKIATFSYRGGIEHKEVKGWEDNDMSFNYSWSFFNKHSPGGSNYDAIDIEFAVKELLKREEEKKLLIVISDGSPCCPNEEVRKIVDTAREKGIFVISLFVGTEEFIDRYWEEYKEMYTKYFIGTTPDKMGLYLARLLETFIEED